MADENPFGEGNPFEGMPFFSDLSKLFEAMSGSQWAQARQMAISMAAGTGSEPNVDPTDRMAFESLARVAEMHVTQQSGLVVSSTGLMPLRPATRSEWAAKTVDQYRSYLEIVGSSLGSSVAPEPGVEVEMAESSDPAAAAMGAMMAMLGPMMVSVTAGSMVGHLAQTSFGYYDLPLPRPDIDEILVLNTNIEAFISEWELPRDDVRMWVSLNELAHHAVLRVPHVGERFRDLITDYASHFSADNEAIRDHFGNVDLQDFGAMAAMQEQLGDPDAFLGLLESERQREVQPFISSLLAVIEGYVDWVLDSIGTRLISTYPQITEAVRRRRVTAGPADRFVGRMFGIELNTACFERGTSFVDGVIARSGESALGALWTDEANLPTPAEVDAPGLWLARLGLPNNVELDVEIDISDLDDFDIDDLEP